MRGSKRLASGLVAATLLWPAACAMGNEGRRPHDSIAGRASVIDGDGLLLEGTTVRLFGIDAPETGQYCNRSDGTRFRCGQYATVALDRLVQGHTVECRVKTHDRYERSIAVCHSQGKDLGREMVAAGWAVAYRRYSRDYVDAEQAARRSRLGVWAGSFEMPWVWRSAHRREQGR